MKELDRVWIFRLVHVENLATLLNRGGLHAPGRVPADGLVYRSIHDVDVQSARHRRIIPCGPGGSSDGHGLASFTRWYEDLSQLDQVDWQAVHARYWAADATDNDRQRRKQAELLVHHFCPWSVIRGIAVIDQRMRRQVEEILEQHPEEPRRQIAVRPEWYY